MMYCTFYMYATLIGLAIIFPWASQHDNWCPEDLLPTLSPEVFLSALVPITCTGYCVAHWWSRDLLSAGRQPVPAWEHLQTSLLCCGLNFTFCTEVCTTVLGRRPFPSMSFQAYGIFLSHRVPYGISFYLTVVHLLNLHNLYETSPVWFLSPDWR